MDKTVYEQEDSSEPEVVIISTQFETQENDESLPSDPEKKHEEMHESFCNSIHEPLLKTSGELTIHPDDIASHQWASSGNTIPEAKLVPVPAKPEDREAAETKQQTAAAGGEQVTATASAESTTEAVPAHLGGSVQGAGKTLTVSASGKQVPAIVRTEPATEAVSAKSAGIGAAEVKMQTAAPNARQKVTVQGVHSTEAVSMKSGDMGAAAGDALKVDRATAAAVRQSVSAQPSELPSRVPELLAELSAAEAALRAELSAAEAALRPKLSAARAWSREQAQWQSLDRLLMAMFFLPVLICLVCFATPRRAVPFEGACTYSGSGSPSGFDATFNVTISCPDGINTHIIKLTMEVPSQAVKSELGVNAQVLGPVLGAEPQGLGPVLGAESQVAGPTLGAEPETLGSSFGEDPQALEPRLIADPEILESTLGAEPPALRPRLVADSEVGGPTLGAEFTALVPRLVEDPELLEPTLGAEFEAMKGTLEQSEQQSVPEVVKQSEQELVPLLRQLEGKFGGLLKRVEFLEIASSDAVASAVHTAGKRGDKSEVDDKGTNSHEVQNLGILSRFKFQIRPDQINFDRITEIPTALLGLYKHLAKKFSGPKRVENLEALKTASPHTAESLPLKVDSLVDPKTASSNEPDSQSFKVDSLVGRTTATSDAPHSLPLRIEHLKDKDTSSKTATSMSQTHTNQAEEVGVVDDGTNNRDHGNQDLAASPGSDSSEAVQSVQARQIWAASMGIPEWLPAYGSKLQAALARLAKLVQQHPVTRLAKQWRKHVHSAQAG